MAGALRAGTADRTASLARWFTPAEIAGSDPLVGAVRRRLLDADAAGWAAALEMVADFDVLGELASLRMPVDVIAAEHDGVAVPEHMARMAQAVPGSAFHEVPGARHLLPLQRPGVVAPLLGAWSAAGTRSAPAPARPGPARVPWSAGPSPAGVRSPRERIPEPDTPRGRPTPRCPVHPGH
ncbi:MULTISPECIES: hypothetical protein [Pseudonocardia]|uniref:hypothetical protein n=1 Tax=Pseudonocardia TaxID=1847 RepID=UPI000F7A914B|nr:MULTISPECIES: hypothetical protein [Pseudonocardia]